MYKKTIVIGSGPSGTSFAKALLKKNQKVTMIDVGYTKKDNFYENNYDKYNPRLSKFNNSFVEKNFKNFNKITEINFKAVGSLALGGLSNVWGGGAYNINKNLYIKKLPFFKESEEAIKKSFRFKKNKRNALLNLLLKKNLYSDINFFKDRSLFSELKEDFYNSKDDIQEFKKNNKFTYLNGFFVKKIIKDGKFYKLCCIKNGKIHFIKCKYLILACGTLGTTNLVLKYLKYKKKIKLKHTYHINFIGYLNKPIKNNNFKKLKALMHYEFKPSYIKKINKIENCYGGVGLLSEEVIKFVFRRFPNFLINILIKFANLFKDRIIIGNCFLPHFITKSTIQLKNNKLIIKGGLNKKNSHIIRKVRFDLKKIFNQIASNIIFKTMPIGSDVHYFGTLGNQHAKALEVRNNCELKGHNNLYLVDGSTIKDLDNKFPTEIIMINAYRVGIVLSKKIKNE